MNRTVYRDINNHLRQLISFTSAFFQVSRGLYGPRLVASILEKFHEKFVDLVCFH